jgi:hypothetical protein
MDTRKVKQETEERKETVVKLWNPMSTHICTQGYT